MPRKKKLPKNNQVNDDIRETPDIFVLNEVIETKKDLATKKRFSFPKKRRTLNQHNCQRINQENSSLEMKGTLEVRRSYSMSTKHQSTNKVAFPIFHTLQLKKRNISGSCGNFESTSMVLNPGMDNWRMSGLLDTVEKSNSVYSLHSVSPSSSFSEKINEKNWSHGALLSSRYVRKESEKVSSFLFPLR